SVEGPLNIARSAQGQPVIFQAGTSEDGKNLGARYASGIFADPKTLDVSQSVYRDLKGRAARFGRSPDELLFMPGITPIIGRTEEEAERKYQQELELLSLEKALHFLGRFFDH
ncbi:LLM class flavin-dependent oxidoreductase, partial [Paenibacillus sepulcri]|nr:LLM class flavin-dependent oxidoreductase [Paenibacillus sepulcri]